MQQKFSILGDFDVSGVLCITKFRGSQQKWLSNPQPNKVVSSSGYGRNLLARVLAGDATYPPEITSASLGTGNLAAADGDTNLQTPVATGLTITNMTVTNDQLQVDVFVPDGSLPNGTYKEFGLFCGGRLFCRIIISPSYTKGSGEDTLFSYQLTLTG